MANIRKENRRFPGMKKNVKPGNKKGVKLKPYKPVEYEGRLKYGLSDYQKRTNAEFLKVREGETKEQWLKRTRRRRVKEIDEVKELATTHPLRIHFRNRERISTERNNQYIMVQALEREFDFMRYYGIVINYYSIKYGIRTGDFQIGFYFFSNIPFTKDRFENACVLHFGDSQGKLTRFLKNGYLEDVYNLQKKYNGDDKKVKTNLYRFTKEFINKLTTIYRTLGKMNGLTLYRPPLKGLPPEVKQLIIDMNDEVQDIQTGRKPEEK